MAFVALPMSSAMAQDNTPYLDDRTSAATLIKSLYNAINRKEYGRAWGYFSVPPVSNFATFENGFASTVNVEVLTGGAIEEGAAGATMYTLPVAIQAEDSAGR
ncbi:MAG: DUF1176 domain-containing protein, partial [Proteobacteria bacterium]|nr:DUF1176 domain-containing protein [Pseudomonadota bacterium]